MTIVDTNVLLDYPQIIEERKDLLILTDVLKELDGLKRSSNNETAFQARRAAVMISRNMDYIDFFGKLEKENMPVDDKLIKVAKVLDSTLVTNDVYLKVRARAAGVDVIGYGVKDDYEGTTTIFLEADENEYSAVLDYILENKSFPSDFYKKPLFENQYFIIKDSNSPYQTKNGETDYTVLAILVYKNKELRMLSEKWDKKTIVNKWINKITPKNPEQQCLFHALHNRDISIIYAGGQFGTGKSFVLNNFAIQELESEKIKKIVYVPNNAFTENTMELGALPGELLEKTVGQIGPLIDLVGIDQVQDWIKTEQLEIVPMGFIRGRSFQDTIIIVNEAQNLTEDHIKLLIARCGNGSRIFFDGDFKQADSAIFRNKNGLKLLLQLRKSPIYSKIFATVKMNTIERSLTAQASAYLDSLNGGI